MPRPPHVPNAGKDLGPYKDQIIALYGTKLSAAQIARHLDSEHSILVTGRTINRHLIQWGYTTRCRVEDSPQLRRRITALFHASLADKDMLLALQSEGFKIKKTGLARLRREMGLWRRVAPPDRDESKNHLEEINVRSLSLLAPPVANALCHYRIPQLQLASTMLPFQYHLPRFKVTTSDRSLMLLIRFENVV
jgi:hypothetical protein